MSTDVEEQVVYHAIEHLDFEVPCGLRTQWWVKFLGFTVRLPQSPRCKEPVQWEGTLPCCGATALVCTKHRRETRLGVMHCGVRWTLLNLTWRRI